MEKKKTINIKKLLSDNSIYVFLVLAILVIEIIEPSFLSISSIVNIISLTAASLPMALGIAGTIILTGTDLSAGRMVGLTACVSAALLQSTDYIGKLFAGIPTMPIFVALIAALLIGAIFGCLNGFFVAKFSIHPFIVTLSTQLVMYGILLMFLMIGNNNGQTLSGLAPEYMQFVSGSILSIGGTPIPNYVWFAVIITVIMWVIWNKTAFGKNMFAIGSNAESARVAGVRVTGTIIGVFILAGILYGYTGFIEAARIGSNSASTGLNYELDAIAACVIGGVSFVGGTGKIKGVVTGVLLLRIIFVGLMYIGVDSNFQYIIKGAIILTACIIDMKKYRVRK
ncbi:MAG: beta-methylgalactoside transporter [Lachnospiraceae bacterium]|nr:beta-methylgalactoside transporter [Candidatus Darwinimomas equi]